MSRTFTWISKRRRTATAVTIDDLGVTIVEGAKARRVEFSAVTGVRYLQGSTPWFLDDALYFAQEGSDAEVGFRVFWSADMQFTAFAPFAAAAEAALAQLEAGRAGLVVEVGLGRKRNLQQTVLSGLMMVPVFVGSAVWYARSEADSEIPIWALLLMLLPVLGVVLWREHRRRARELEIITVPELSDRITEHAASS